MKTRTAHTIILSAIVLLLVIAGSLYGGWLLRGKLLAVREYRKGQQDLGLNDETIQGLDATVKKAFIPATQVLALIQELEDDARTLGLQITVEKVRQGDVQPLAYQKGSTNLATFSLQLDGTYALIRQFTAGVLARYPGLSLKSMSLSRSGSAGQAYEARIELEGILLTQ